MAQANSYIMALDDAFRHLAEMPEIAREQTLVSPPVRIYQTGKHNVIYRVLDGQLLIMRVLHVRADWQAQFDT